MVELESINLQILGSHQDSFLTLEDFLALKVTCKRLLNSVVNLFKKSPAPVLLGGLQVRWSCGTISGARSLKHARVYQYLNDTFLNLPDMLYPRYLAASCVLPDGKIFVAGGIVECDVKALLPNKLAFNSSLTIGFEEEQINGNLFKGRFSATGKKTRRVEVYCPMKRQWQELEPLPEAVAGGKACLSPEKDCVWLIGGSTELEDHEISYSNRIMEFDIKNGKWTLQSKRLKQSRTEFGLMRSNNSILVFGGTNKYVTGQHRLSIEQYHFNKGDWENADEGVNSVPERIGSNPVTHKGNLLLVGGVTTFSNVNRSLGEVSESELPQDSDIPFDSETEEFYELSMYIGNLHNLSLIPARDVVVLKGPSNNCIQLDSGFGSSWAISFSTLYRFGGLHDEFIKNRSSSTVPSFPFKAIDDKVVCSALINYHTLESLMN